MFRSVTTFQVHVRKTTLSEQKRFFHSQLFLSLLEVYSALAYPENLLKLLSQQKTPKHPNQKTPQNPEKGKLSHSSHFQKSPLALVLSGGVQEAAAEDLSGCCTHTWTLLPLLPEDSSTHGATKSLVNP